MAKGKNSTKTKQTGEKLHLTDIAAAWKAGWTPQDVNDLLDRFEAMGDPTDPPELDDDEDLDDILDDPGSEDNDPGDDIDDPSDGGDDDDSDSDDIDANLDKIKKTGMEVQLSDLQDKNKRLEKELRRLKAQNRNKDVSNINDDQVSPEQSLIDAFQSCY